MSQGEYEKVLSSYNKDHRIMNQQRNLTHYISGNKVERVKFNPKNGSYGWEKGKKKR